MFSRKPILARARAERNSFQGLRLIADSIMSSREYPEAIPAAQARILRIRWFLSEVMNGRIVQYFWNSSGDGALDLENDLLEIGCPEIHSAVRAARIEVFGSTFAVDTTERRISMEAYFHTHPFNDDDDLARIARIAPAPLCEAASDAVLESGYSIPTAALVWAESVAPDFAMLR